MHSFREAPEVRQILAQRVSAGYIVRTNLKRRRCGRSFSFTCIRFSNRRTIHRAFHRRHISWPPLWNPGARCFV